MRKHVKPALPLAVILDPERGKRLPQQGALVAWSHYWAALEARGDVEVVAEPSPADAPPAEAAPVAPDATETREADAHD